VSIFDRTRVAVVVAGALAMVALVRCAAPTTCLRISDCDVGLTCVSGACVTALASGDVEASVLQGSAGEASAPPTDAKVTTSDTSTGDATRVEREAGDASESEDAGDVPIDTADF